MIAELETGGTSKRPPGAIMAAGEASDAQVDTQTSHNASTGACEQTNSTAQSTHASRCPSSPSRTKTLAAVRGPAGVQNAKL